MSLHNSKEPEVEMIDDREAVTADFEKAPKTRTIENIRVIGLTDEDAAFYEEFSATRRKEVLRKVDMRLVPMLAILYLIGHLDRANIGNAKIEGLGDDLNLVGNQWNIVLSLFFIPYVLFEVPSNILLKKFKRPSSYLGILVTVWGIIMTLHGVVNNFGQLLAVRILLGIFEAGFFPGAVYLCTFWYMPKDLASRIAWFYCTSALSGAFSGLLAAGIAQMDGIGGYQGWRWIFIIEGLFTVFLGITVFFLLIDTPELSGRWLSPDEIRYLELQRFIKEGGRFAEDTPTVPWHELKAVVTNWRIYLLSFLLLGISACAYGTKYTLPTITKSMGFSSTNAQLMTVPAYIAGALSSIFFSRLSDHYHWRMPFVAIPMALIAIGNAIIISFKGDLGGSHIGPAYFGIILMCMGIYPVQPAASSWTANNIAPSSRRAIGVAFNLCVGNIGGIIGSYMFLDAEAPAYWTGFGLSLAFGAMGVVVSLILEASYKFGNQKRAKLNEDDIRSRYSEEELLRLGDKSPLFKYTL